MREFVLILPEVIIALTLVFVVIAEITYHGEQVRFVTTSTLLGLAAAFVQTLVTYQYGPVSILNGAISVDGLSLLFKIFFIILAALTIVSVSHTREVPEDRRSEFIALVIAATLGMCIAAAAADLLLIFLSLSLLNIVSYFLASYGKTSLRSIEAGVKYMIVSGVAGALLLYGFALLFAMTHSLNIYEAHRALLLTTVPREALLVVFVLVFLSLAFQIAGFPMYLWAPDVLEGSPTPTSAFISLASRAVGFAVAIRFFIVIFAQPALAPGQWSVLGALDWTRLLGIVSGLTMLAGSFLALRQSSAKRLVGCLVIAQSGFLLMGILVLDQVGVAALLYNLMIELFALIGVFYVLSFFHDHLGSDDLVHLKGMLTKAVPECICLVLFLLCVVGVPPTPGFIGKFSLIGAVVRHQNWSLAMVAIVSLTVSTVSLARLSFHLVGDWEVNGQAMSVDRTRRLFLVVLLLPILLSGLFANQLLGWAGKSLGFILW